MNHLKKPSNLAIIISTATIMFAWQYRIMATLPGSKNLQCAVGANLTPNNIVFAIIISLLTGIMLATMITLLKSRAIRKGIAAGSLSSMGLAMATLTLFCTLCTIPVISLFGLSIGLTVFTDYSLWFQIASILTMIAAILLTNKQLRNSFDTKAN